MALSVFQSCKKRKRTAKMVGSQIFGDHLDDPPPPMDLSGPFRENIRFFIRDFGDPEDYTVAGNPAWSILLVSHSNGVVFPLFIVEENVKRSPNPLCDICRCVGWSNHFVSRRRYHLIIPRDEDWNKPLKRDVLNLHTHLLHAVVHCNGFGHLIRINGSEEGSKFFRGEEIMDLWDRICNTLQTRKITVDDAAKQKSMELRLLHGVAYGRSWFGRWGYKFCHGRFGVTEQKYNRAIEILSSLDLNRVISDFSGTERGRVVQKIVKTYRAMSENQLTTIGDLLQFMLVYASKAPIQRKTASALANIAQKPSPSPPAAIAVTTDPPRHKSPLQEKEKQSTPVEYPHFASVAPKLDSRYPLRRLEQAARVIVDVLTDHKASNPGRANMSRQEVRDASRAHIGDTGLIDFTLKNIHNTVLGNRVVRRLTNPSTRVLEFSVESVNGAGETELEMSTVESPEPAEAALPPESTEPRVDVNDDVLYLYKKVLMGYTKSETVSGAVRVVLDSNHFVKEWVLKDGEDDDKIRLLCRFMPSYDELESELTRPLQPGEVVVVPQCTTVGELKMAAQSALRDTYCIMEQLVVRDVKVVGSRRETDGGEGETGLTCAVESWSEVWVRGCRLDLGTKLRYEGGAENWTVDCGGCGARDDDGERMVACDGCQVWQHTRCNNIEDGRDAPQNFLCHWCSSTRIKRPSNYKP